MNHHHTQFSPSSQNSDGVLFVWKEAGETLSVLLCRVRSEYGIDEKEKITYAGRLDPMAEGLVLLLVGDARFEKEHYLRLDKTYEATIVFGFTTDSLDALGILSDAYTAFSDEARVREVFASLSNELQLPYPRYSSKPVNGKPLFAHARSGRKVHAPLHTLRLFKKELLKFETVNISDLAKEAIEIIQRVEGDFRQEACISSWQQFTKKYGDKSCLVCTIRCTVGSGTYIRALATYIGQLCGTFAYAHKIKRISFESINII